MLILTRYIGEKMMIGDDVTVEMLGIRGNQIRLGIAAPKEVRVHREEVWRQIQAQKAGVSLQAILADKPYLSINETLQLCQISATELFDWVKTFAQVKILKRNGNEYCPREVITVIQRIRELIYVWGKNIESVRDILNTQLR